jgi:hypothetical protein
MRIINRLPTHTRVGKKAVEHEAKLCYLGHLLTENRNGVVVNTLLTAADV